MFTEENIEEIINSGIKIANKKFQENNFYESELILKQILKVNTTNKNALQLLGLIEFKKNNFHKAIDIFQKCLNQNDLSQEEIVENYNNEALCHAGLGDFEASIRILNKASQISSKAYIWSNLGLQYRNKGEIQKAIDCFKKAIDIDPTEQTWCMLAGCYGTQQDLDKAEKCICNALDLNSAFAPAHVDLAYIYQLRGEWEKAWKEYEWRENVYEQIQFWKQIYEPEKKWTGQELFNKRILVHAEQGIGDAIHFVRYVPALKNLGATTIIHCWEGLENLFKDLCDEIYVVDPSKIPTYQTRKSDFNIPKYDFYCSMMSLPRWLNIEIPKTPYLKTNKKIDIKNSGLKIGIIWAGNPQHPNDSQRSCFLNNFREISELPNVQMYSLQKDTRMRAYRFSKEPIDLTENSEGLKLIDMSNIMNDFEDTAAIIKSMDLIIGVDTAVLHLCGAINHPGYILLPYNPDWRWKLTGDTSEWYPSLKLFRQSKYNDWKSVFALVKERLKNDYLLSN